MLSVLRGYVCFAFLLLMQSKESSVLVEDHLIVDFLLFVCVFILFLPRAMDISFASHPI